MYKVKSPVTRPTVFRYTDIVMHTDRCRVSFGFEMNTGGKCCSFSEKLCFPGSLPDTETIKALLSQLHIALGLSYYKIFAPPAIEHPYRMDAFECDFWNEVFSGGLAEYAYRNQLGFDDLARFMPCRAESRKRPQHAVFTEGVLLGIGGGKDSIVAGEVLKKAGIVPRGFILATEGVVGQSVEVAAAMNINCDIVTRRLDPQLFVLTAQPGAYNGHIPISLIYALTGMIVAQSLGLHNIAAGNEASADNPHRMWQGREVNHQWSKSQHFEKRFCEFLHHTVSTHLCYFSPIRSLGSIAVCRIFSTLREYHHVFSSDNAVLRITNPDRAHTRWTMSSPKSLSTFILLLPWLDEASMLSIFGRDYLNEPGLAREFACLTGMGEAPQLDCVGTPPELRLSLQMANAQGKCVNSCLMKQARNWFGSGTHNTAAVLSQHLVQQRYDGAPLAWRERLRGVISEMLL